MTPDHYGLDVRVLTIGSKDVIAEFESFSAKYAPSTKEATAAQDDGPNKRITGGEWTITLSKFVRSKINFLQDYVIANEGNLSFQFIMSDPGSGKSGTAFKTAKVTGGVLSSSGIDIGGDATKEDIEFTCKKSELEWS